MRMFVSRLSLGARRGDGVTPGAILPTHAVHESLSRERVERSIDGDAVDALHAPEHLRDAHRPLAAREDRDAPGAPGRPPQPRLAKRGIGSGVGLVGVHDNYDSARTA